MNSWLYTLIPLCAENAWIRQAEEDEEEEDKSKIQQTKSKNIYV